MVEYERRIASGKELADGDSFRCCSGLSPKVHFLGSFHQCCGKQFSHLFNGSYRLIQFNNYKGSMRN